MTFNSPGRRSDRGSSFLSESRRSLVPTASHPRAGTRAIGVGNSLARSQRWRRIRELLGPTRPRGEATVPGLLAGAERFARRDRRHRKCVIAPPPTESRRWPETPGSVGQLSAWQICWCRPPWLRRPASAGLFVANRFAPARGYPNARASADSSMPTAWRPRGYPERATSAKSSRKPHRTSNRRICAPQRGASSRV